MKVLAVALLVLSAGTFADEVADKAALFGDVKQAVLTNLDQRISNLQEAKTCVSAANDQAALKACKQKMMESQKALHAQMKGQREGFRAKRQGWKAQNQAGKVKSN